jgi:hypothetical protein
MRYFMGRFKNKKTGKEHGRVWTFMVPWLYKLFIETIEQKPKN